MREAAQRGGYSYGTFRNLCSEFRKQESSDFFWPKRSASEPKAKPHDARPQRIVALRRAHQASIYQIAGRLKQEELKASPAYIALVLKRAGHECLPRRTAQ